MSGTKTKKPFNLSSGRGSRNTSIEEVDCLEMEVVAGNKTHVLTVFLNSNLKEITKQFAKEKGLPANVEKQLY